MSIELTGQEIIDLVEMLGLTITPDPWTMGIVSGHVIIIDECPEKGFIYLDEEDPKLKHYPHVAYCYGYQDESVQPIGDEL